MTTLPQHPISDAIIIASWVFLAFAIGYRVFARKQKEAPMPAVKLATQNNMLQEAKWLLRIIHNAHTYAEICAAEDHLHRWKQTYRGTEGFPEVLEDLDNLIALHAQISRMKDRATFGNHTEG